MLRQPSRSPVIESAASDPSIPQLENVPFPETKTFLSSLAWAVLMAASRIANADAVIECKMRLMTLSYAEWLD
jgi:hypothetical protein